MENNKLPITRLSKFFSQEDFDLQTRLGQEYLHGDLNMRLVLYRVDRSKTDIDNVYGEVGKDEIKYFPPIEFNGLVEIERPKNSSYQNGILRFNEPGNLLISVYIEHLNEKKIDINYGDFIGYPESENKLRFYTVTDDGKVTSNNENKMFGFKPHYRNIKCSPVQENEFRGV